MQDEPNRDAGYLICGSRRLNFDDANACWCDDGLTLEANGDDCWFSLQEYQEIQVQPFEAILGKSWNQPDVNGEVPQVHYRGEDYETETFVLTARTFDAERGVLTMHVAVKGRSEDDGRRREFDILLRLQTEGG